MTNKAQSKLIRKLKEMYAKLEKRGGPEGDGELFEEILGLEEDILEMSGLKPTRSNSEILHSIMKSPNVDAGIALVQDLLEIAASQAEEENLAPLEFLAKGLSQNEDPYDVLPNMGLLTHEYTLYLYDLLRTRGAPVIEVYNELMRTKDLLGDISVLKQNFKALKRRNVAFLEAFLQSDMADVTSGGTDSGPAPPAQSPGGAGLSAPATARTDDLIAQVSEIVQTEDPEQYRVRFVVFPEKEVRLAHEAADSDERVTVHTFVYDMTISMTDDAVSMSPEGDLQECMELYSQEEFDENLNPTLRRKWKTAYLADKIAAELISSRILGFWKSGEEY